jgi:transposase
MQFIEKLSDRQTVEAVKSRIDWKYALGLSLDDQGFDHSVLSEFRGRILQGSAEQLLLDTMLKCFREAGLLKTRGRQRTDSTHILGLLRDLNRLELIGETVRAALNRIALVAPEWLKDRVPETWYERYSTRIEQTRLPASKAARVTWAQQTARDGRELLESIYSGNAPEEVRSLPIVEILRQIWVQKIMWIDDEPFLRDVKDGPPIADKIESPYETEARYGRKSHTIWRGYQAHFTETCDDEHPHLVINVLTGTAGEPDCKQTQAIHENLKAKDLLPAVHYLDSGYIDGEILATTPTDYGIEIVGPARPNVSHQAKANRGYDSSCFHFDWEKRIATCPQGNTTDYVTDLVDNWGNDYVQARFSARDCKPCPVLELCTRSKKKRRYVAFRPQASHEANLHNRQQQQTPEWQERYKKRAGVEGTISQAVRRCGGRQSRYRGATKTHLQQVFIATAINLIRVNDWLMANPRATTRISHFAQLQEVA